MKSRQRTSFASALGVTIAALALIACGDDDDAVLDSGVSDAPSIDAPFDVGNDAPRPTDGGTDVLPATCDDGLRNQNETDTDCGGVCGATCIPSQSCGEGGDCTTDNCEASVCQPMPTCSDARLNGAESAVDCGGPMCLPCADGRSCTAQTDCVSMVCSGDICQAPICGDGVNNRDEEACDGDGAGTGGES